MAIGMKISDFITFSRFGPTLLAKLAKTNPKPTVTNGTNATHKKLLSRMPRKFASEKRVA
jgi:hypothetical protein